ncbi:MAG: glycine zipper domain-containing protein [Beijerinckiaceae bacterium]
MKKSLLVAGALAASLSLAACGRTPGERTASGAVIGAATGAAVGAATTGRAGGALVGAAVGGVGGAVIGRSSCRVRYTRSGRRYCARPRY